MRRSSYPHPTNPLPIDHPAYATKEIERQAARIKEIREELAREMAELDVKHNQCERCEAPAEGEFIGERLCNGCNLAVQEDTVFRQYWNSTISFTEAYDRTKQHMAELDQKEKRAA